jgi:hypothetical protein
MPALAQQQYGTMSGTVVDSQQLAMPGVTVTLSGPAMQGTRTAVTDENGRYRFAPVPPGIGYLVKFELQGFNTLEQSGLIVNIGRETTLDAAMAPTQFAETITVTAEKLVIDTSKSAVDTAVDWQLLDATSNNRLFQSVMGLAPGVGIDANNPQVHGASDGDNIYLVDGIDNTDPLTQTWGSMINFDTIQEVQLQTAGFAAEFGRVTGGVVNLVTKSGGNDFSGILRYVQTDVDWSSDFKEGRSAAILSDEKRPSASLGGPIAKDALWFFVSYEERDRKQQFPRATDPTNSSYYQDTNSYAGHYLSGKLTWQLSPKHSIMGYYNEDPIDISDAWARYYLGTGVDPRSETAQIQGGNAYSLTWTGVLSPNSFLEARYCSYNGNIDLEPAGPLGPEPTTYEMSTDYWSGTTLELYKSDRTRESAYLAGSFFLDSGSSSHQLKAGIEWLENKNTVLDAYYPSGGPVEPGTFLMLWEGENDTKIVNYNREGAVGSKNPYWAFFIQDAWKIGTLTINAGLRFEQVELVNNVGNTVAKFDFQDQIAPRLGFAWDLNGDSLHGSASRFYDIVSDYVTRSLNVNNERQTVYLWGPAYGLGDDWAEVADYALFTSNTVNPDLKPTYTDEFSIGYDKRLTASLAASINYVWRQQKDAIEDIDAGILGDAEADDGAIYWTNVPETWMKYQAIEVSLNKRFAADRIQFITSYTYALENEGFVAFTGNSQLGFASQGGGYGDSSVAVVNRYGKQDTPDMFKFSGSYSFPFGLDIGLNARWYSGGRYSSYRSVSLPTGRGTEFTEPAGSREIGAWWDTDLHVEQAVKLGARAALSAYVDVFNVFDNQEPILRQGLTTSSVYTQPNQWQAPRRYQVGVKFEF